MIKNINKKGSHVGVVVSFVIFITFLIFLYSILQPVTFRERNKDYILDYLTLNIIRNSTGNMTTMIINVDELVTKDCINIQQLSLSEIPIEFRDNLMFKTDTESLNYKLQNINTIYVEVPEGGFIGIITVYFSEEIVPRFDNTLGGCDPNPYPVGYVRTFSEIFGTKITELNETYYADYEGLKAYLGLPEGTEFNFYLLSGTREVLISAEIQETPTDRSVYVEETPIQYADDDGNILFGFLVVKVW